jgi:DNA-binding GntR family transcriptional regulator
MKEARTSREKIYEELKSEIFDGRLRPSDVLAVDDLARRFGVSRTPVREALIALSNKGLLDARYHVGFIVTSIDVREIIETYHLRILLEKESVRLAVRNI